MADGREPRRHLDEIEQRSLEQRIVGNGGFDVVQFGDHGDHHETAVIELTAPVRAAHATSETTRTRIVLV